MREDRRRRYDDGFRREALELIKSGAGKDALVRRLAIPVYTARNWIGLWIGYNVLDSPMRDE